MKVKTKVWRYGLILSVVINSLSVYGYTDSLLAVGDEVMLAAPESSFRNHLKRIKLAPAQFEVVEGGHDKSEFNMTAEAEDLRAALRKAGGKDTKEIERIVSSQFRVRTKLKEFEDRVEAAQEPTTEEVNEHGDIHLKAPHSTPAFPKIDIEADLPEEFADYFKGTVAWHNPALTNKAVARQAWERILNRPREAGRFKSTAAAYMLAKTWEKDNPEKAIDYYQQVRVLAKAGFSDGLGLAAASFGQEARVYLSETNYERAIELYLQQLATGDESACVSLCFVMRELMRGPTESFTRLVRNPPVREVVTAYMMATKALQISYENRWNSEEGNSNRLVEVVSDWLTANKEAQVNDEKMAEQLGLVAYQNGAWDAAEYWIARAGSGPTAQWLKAKLLFRGGKILEGGTLLTKVARMFPLNPASEEPEAPTELKDDLTISYRNAAHCIRGELGVLHVSHGLYTAALQDFLLGGYWIDAAYVAERVLTVDELKSFVDAYCPLVSPVEGEKEGDGVLEASLAEAGPRLRYLLARRLTRTNRGNESREYYPTVWQGQFDSLAEALKRGWDESQGAEMRARALFTAATLARAHGMELLGTEVGPDWHICNGNGEGALSGERRKNQQFILFVASSEELARVEAHKADPERRFHYRFQAAFLGWEAAKLMANGSEETARVLCISGSWLKGRDDRTADLFYKALVRRCPETAIGREADRIRWFPKLDDSGNVIPRNLELESSPPEEEPMEKAEEEISTEFPVPGTNYVVHAGDTLEAIAEAASAWGEPVTVEEIIDANPELNPSELATGQEIRVPGQSPPKN